MFIVENLLFYSKLFQDLLPRLFRLDLSSPKNAYMLFRVCKVNIFSTIDIKSFKSYSIHISSEFFSHLFNDNSHTYWIQNTLTFMYFLKFIAYYPGVHADWS